MSGGLLIDSRCDRAVRALCRYISRDGPEDCCIHIQQWTPSSTDLAYIARKVKQHFYGSEYHIAEDRFLQYSYCTTYHENYLYFKKRDTPQLSWQPRHLDTSAPPPVSVPHPVPTAEHSAPAVFDPNKIIVVRVQASAPGHVSTPLPPHLLDQPNSRVDREVQAARAVKRRFFELAEEEREALERDISAQRSEADEEHRRALAEANEVHRRAIARADEEHRREVNRLQVEAERRKRELEEQVELGTGLTQGLENAVLYRRR